jgi:hypothetical protein
VLFELCVLKLRYFILGGGILLRFHYNFGLILLSQRIISEKHCHVFLIYFCPNILFHYSSLCASMRFYDLVTLQGIKMTI